MFFVVNDLLFENNLILSKDIINFLLNRKIWLFNKTTPNVKYISPGDRVIVYVAGRKNKFFSAKFIIDSHLTPNQLDHDTPLEAMLSYNFELQCSIKNLVMWKKPLSIYDVKSYLNFINDPKN
jgi:hypothetical protein